MTKKYFASIALLAGLLALPCQSLAAGSVYPSQNLINQFGEKSLNLMVGGSNQIDCSFVVDSANVNGKGISGLSGSGCASIYMHTSQTPAAGNPNPVVGYIIVNLASQYSGAVESLVGSISSPVNGVTVAVSSAGVVANNPYVITTVGSTTPAGWQNLGLPVGFTPSVGQSFIATSTTVSTGSGVVEAPNTSGSGAAIIDMVGDANKMVGATAGAQMLLRVLSPTSSSVTTLIAAAPADTSIVRLRFSMLPLSSSLK